MALLSFEGFLNFFLERILSCYYSSCISTWYTLTHTENFMAFLIWRICGGVEWKRFVRLTEVCRY